MLLLIFYSFLAGIVTILSPCILPVLPIVLSVSVSSKDIFKKQIGTITGFISSFTFFTLFLSSLVSLSDISPNSLRLISIFIIALLGLSMLSSKVQGYFEKIFAFIANKAPLVKGDSNSFWSGFLVGLSLGLIWTPCVGPILASVITLALSGTVTINAFLITFAYSVGTAIPMLAVMVGGKSAMTKIPFFARNGSQIQKVFGLITIFIALSIYKNWDRSFQQWILNKFPSYGTSLTFIENMGDTSLISGVPKNETVGDLSLLPVIKKAPDIIPGGAWLNTKEPLSLSTNLKGKVVLVDFWTYTCINCIRTLPYLQDWHQKYESDGLVIIGVHAPEFEFEKDLDNLSKAVADFEIKYPVVQDNYFSTWRAYNNNYWPAKYLIDAQGNLRYYHFGEGKYDETEKAIQSLLAEIGSKTSNEVNNKENQNYSKTPEIYLGYGRGDVGLLNQRNKYTYQTAPKSLRQNQVAFSGNWLFSEEFAQSDTNSEIILKFNAKDVFLVATPLADQSKVKIFLDDKFIGETTFDQKKLYQILNLPTPGIHTLKIIFPENKVQLFAFTFG